MNTCSKSKIGRVAKVLALGSLPVLCLAALCSAALLSARYQGNRLFARHYDMTQFLADARQVAAIIHYLAEIEPPTSTPSTQLLAQNVRALAQIRPPLTYSNYTLLLTNSQADHI